MRIDRVWFNLHKCSYFDATRNQHSLEQPGRKRLDGG
jgi:hypothetical protein